MRMMKKRTGFTLVEIMIVVAIIGILATIAVPSFMRARANASITRFTNDLRVASAAFQQFNIDSGRYPTTSAPGVIPAGMEPYLVRFPWMDSPATGGRWVWQYNSPPDGFTAALLIRDCHSVAGGMTNVDRSVDDGDLNTGLFRKIGPDYAYIIEE